MQDPEDLIIGTGWSFPPTFSRRSASVEMVTGNRDIRESLWILFSTRLGERIMLPKYGSGLWDMVFQAMTTTLLTRIEESVRTAILYWEPRIEVLAVTANPDASVAGLVSVSIDYEIRNTNARNNLVYPFYLNEGTVAAPPE